MRQFACKVRLGGSLYNEVSKSEVTVPEIIVLRAIHGADSIIDIKETGIIKRTDADERERLTVVYGKAIAKRAEIVGGMGALIGFGGALADTASGIPAKGGKSKSTAETPPEPEPELEDAEA